MSALNGVGCAKRMEGQLEMYKSPIEVMYTQMRTNMENKIFKAVQDVGINVDKTELVKALEYDRNQYQKGYEDGRSLNKWISVDESMPDEFVSVLGYMTDAGEFPHVRECYRVGNAFYFPALLDRHPVSHWMPMPDKQEEKE